MFYIYLVAMTAMFLVVYTVRTKGIEHAWLVGVLSGVVVEFVLMLAGILFTGEKENIPLLVIGNVVTLIVGLGMVFLPEDLIIHVPSMYSLKMMNIITM